MPELMSTALADVRSRLNESSANFYSDSDLIAWINEGCREVARKAMCLWDQTSILVYPGVQQYAAPSNILKLHYAEFAPNTSINTYPLEIRNYAEMGPIWGVQKGIQQYTPNYLTLWNSPPNLYVILFPIPSQSGLMNMYFYRNAIPATTSQNLDVPEGWWELPILYCEYTALRKNVDPRWKDAKAIYEEKLQDMIAATGWHDAAGQMSYGMTNMPPFAFGGVDLWGG
jgi:hypothetical protein